MASISRDKGGKVRILVCLPDGRRPAIRLGKVSQRVAENVNRHVEALVLAKQTGTLEPESARWLATISDAMHDKLASKGLVAPRDAQPTAALGPFLTSYLEGRADLKSATKVVRGVVIRDLVGFFGETRDVRSITPGSADDFKQSLVRRGLAPTTIHKRLQVARSFFHAMRRRKLIDENPFEGVNAPASGIKDRQRFVTREVTERLLAVCNPTWRTIVALARYGGLRTPSETLSLRWQDIDWAAGRIVVTSPKTEHHAGKATRTIPLFSELRPILMEAQYVAPDGAVFVVDEKYRKAAMGPAGWMNANLRTTLLKLIRRAGLEPWPRLFHNLRASRETELAERFPVQVVTSWLGNTPSIAMRHYLMTTEEHFAAALADNEAGADPAASHAAQKTAQNPAQHAHASVRHDSQAAGCADERTAETHEKTPAVPGCASRSDYSRMYSQLAGIAGTGFEPVTSRL